MLPVNVNEKKMNDGGDPVQRIVTAEDVLAPGLVTVTAIVTDIIVVAPVQENVVVQGLLTEGEFVVTPFCFEQKLISLFQISFTFCSC
jgi:hypothetical protein